MWFDDDLLFLSSLQHTKTINAIAALYLKRIGLIPRLVRAAWKANNIEPNATYPFIEIFFGFRLVQK